MGMMTNLRRFAKRKPILGIIFVVVLSIGLVGSFAYFSIPGEQVLPGGTAADSTAQDEAFQEAIEEKISKLESEIEVLQKELESKPEDAATALRLGDNYYLLAETYYMIGERDKVTENFNEAVANYQQVLKLNPQEKGVYVRLAGAALYAGDMELAETNYQAAIKTDPDDNYARLAYGYLLAIKGDYQEAIDQWQEILNHNPDEDMIEQVNSMIEQARAAIDVPEGNEAEKAPDTANPEEGK